MQATTVAARGSAEAPYTIANFSIHLQAKADNVPGAKARLKTQIEDLNTALSDLKDKLSFKFVKNSVRTSSRVQEVYEYVNNKREMTGYLVAYNLSFQVDDLDKVNQIFDTLTSLPEVSVPNPTFGLKASQREKLSKKALKDAFEKVSERFATECAVLGLDVNDFEISKWETNYHDSQRSDRVAMAMNRGAALASNAYEAAAAFASAESPSAESAGEIDLVSGLAVVAVNLEIGFTKKLLVPATVEKPKFDSSKEE